MWRYIVPTVALLVLLAFAFWGTKRHSDPGGSLRRDDGESEGSMHYTRQFPGGGAS
jgi:hypothetical protein